MFCLSMWTQDLNVSSMSLCQDLETRPQDPSFWGILICAEPFLMCEQVHAQTAPWNQKVDFKVASCSISEKWGRLILTSALQRILSQLKPSQQLLMENQARGQRTASRSATDSFCWVALAGWVWTFSRDRWRTLERLLSLLVWLFHPYSLSWHWEGCFKDNRRFSAVLLFFW